MQLKKLLQGSAFALVAAACAIAVPSVVKADVGGTTGITKIEMEGDQLSVTTSAKELLVGVAKVNTKKNTVTVPSWGSYDVTSSSTAVAVDLSKLSNVKDNYVALTTPGKEVTLVKITAADKKAKAKYVVENGAGVLQVGSGTLAAITPSNAGNYEYRTAYSSQWTSLLDNAAVKNLTMYQEEGAKLFVREVGVKATNNAKKEIKTTSTTETAYKYGDQAVVVLDDTVKLPGKELKVTIPAKAKGPKVTVDYTKGTVKFPKNSEYRVVKAADTSLAAAQNSPSDVTAVSTFINGASDTTGSLEVRTKADKKLASKWTVVAIEKQATFGDSSEIGKITKGVATTKPNATTEDQKYGEWKGTGATMPQLVEKGGSSSVLSFEYKQPNTKKEEYNLVVTSSSSKAYEIVVKKEEPTSSDKVTKLTSAKPVTLKKVTDGNNLWIRVAGDKKATRWVSAWGELAPIDIPKIVPKTGN